MSNDTTGNVINTGTGATTTSATAGNARTEGSLNDPTTGSNLGGSTPIATGPGGSTVGGSTVYEPIPGASGGGATAGTLAGGTAAPATGSTQALATGTSAGATAHASTLGDQAATGGRPMSGASGDRHLVTGLFPDRASAEAAYAGSHERGYGADDMNVVMSDETRQRHFAGDANAPETELGNKAAKGAGVGGAIGGTVGAVAAAIAAIGTSVVMPGLGLVVAGPIAAAIAGAGAGAASGGLLGALIGWGMPEERVKRYEEGVRNGGILMGVRTRNEEDAHHLENHWRTSGGQQVYR